MTKAIKDMHWNEFKVRLTDGDAALVEALAIRSGIPPAVYLRALIKRELQQEATAALTQNGRPAQAERQGSEQQKNARNGRDS